MKSKHLILLILLTASNTLHAREYPALPLHPLSAYHSYSPKANAIRILADSISYIEQSYTTENKGGGVQSINVALTD